ncbi:hypothetical protein COP2_009929 [Malus domestica]
MFTINKSMGNIVKSLKSSLAIGNLQKMSETMDSFENFAWPKVSVLAVQLSMAESSATPQVLNFQILDHRPMSQ